MALIQKLELELKVIWHRANLSKNETERGKLLREYHEKWALLKRQRIQVGAA